MIQSTPTDASLHSIRSRMTESESAIIQKRALFGFMATLRSNGIRCHAKVNRSGGKMYTQYFARVGDQLIPIGDPSMKKSIPPVVQEYILNYYLQDSIEEYEYCIMAENAEDAKEAARAYCNSRLTSQAMLVDANETFIWEF